MIKGGLENDFSQEINLGGKWKFKFEKDKLIWKENKNYVSNLYQKYTRISEISAIVGENGAGKTTALKSLNNIFIGQYDSYILVMEESGIYKIYTNIKRVKVGNVTAKYEIIPIEGRYIGKYLFQKQYDFKLIYFSNIFDKAHLLEPHKNLIDISTNSEWNKQMTKRKKEVSEEALTQYRSDTILEQLPFFNYIHNKLNRKFPK